MSEMTPIRTVLALAVLIAGAACQAADLEVIGPVTFTCDDGTAIEATFDNAPTPATVLLARGEQTFTLPQAISADGARYVGEDIIFWNKGDNAAVDWQGTKLECSETQ